MAWKKVHNSDQNANNLLVATENESGCCGSEQTMCEYTIDDVTVTSAVESITIDGTVYAFATVGSNAATIKAGIDAALIEAGYVEVGGVGTSVVADGSNFDVDVVTEATLTALTKANASTQSFTQKCVEVRVCDFKASFSTGDPGDVGYDGSTDALANAPYSTANGTNADQFATDLAASLTTLSAPYKSVTVSVNSTEDGFDVVVRANYGTEMTIGTKTLAFCKNCKTDYDAA